MRKIFYTPEVILLLIQFGCASMLSGRYQDLQIRSNPEHASVMVDGVAAGETPLVTKAKRSSKHEIQITKEGYIEEIRSTGKGTNPWFAGNILAGGIIGVLIDIATGAAYSVKPKEINVNLVKKQGIATLSPEGQKENKKVKQTIRPEVHERTESGLIFKPVKFVTAPKMGERKTMLLNLEPVEQKAEAKRIEEDFIKTLTMESQQVGK